MCPQIVLTPSRASTNYILNYIFSDILNDSKVGIGRVNPFEIDLCIFIDVIEFVTDYAAMSSVPHLKSHCVEQPCSSCNIQGNGYSGFALLLHYFDSFKTNIQRPVCRKGPGKFDTPVA